MVRRTSLLLLFLACLAACFATDYPLTLTDALGRTVTVGSKPERVITMTPSYTEIACAVNACDRVVGVDMFSNWPAEVLDLPHLGSAFSPNLEAIVALEPDLVLTDASSGLADSLGKLGIPAYASMAEGYLDVFQDFETVGLLLDEETAAAVLSGRVRGAVEQIATMTRELQGPSVYVELDNTPYAAGPDSYIGTLVEQAGGVNVLDAALGPYPRLDPEAVVAADPELIVLLDAPFGTTAASLAERPGWGTIRAVVNGRVIEPTQEQADMLARPGPRLATAVRLLAAWFHPGRF